MSPCLEKSKGHRDGDLQKLLLPFLQIFLVDFIFGGGGEEGNGLIGGAFTRVEIAWVQLRDHLLNAPPSHGRLLAKSQFSYNKTFKRRLDNKFNMSILGSA